MSDPTGPHLAPVPDLPPAQRRRARKPTAAQEAAAARWSSSRSPLLAVVSTVFGMMMAVASDLPGLEKLPAGRASARTRSCIDVRGTQLGDADLQRGPHHRPADEIAPYVQVRDHRRRGPALLRELGRRPARHRRARSSRTSSRARRAGRLDDHPAVRQERAAGAGPSARCFQKLREAALAYHLTRKWSKEKILTEYLNSIYFGNGAYGIEAAARTYFGADPNHEGCGTRQQPVCANELEPARGGAAGRRSSRPRAATTRSRTRPPRAAGATSCCEKMLEQGRITRAAVPQTR